jgi:hypothetical protein
MRLVGIIGLIVWTLIWAGLFAFVSKPEKWSTRL